mmetsp:Transcript_33179/g.48661  ORF Transcript_33179/g.48661 Transcript_33179/m.48661 type:complete len:402 (+) Transcript_33179:106-1311(+)|eukprot:CAMPEP_0195524212 /NCGR_PEP_ID=MMETSP0794_2-20130614/23918_1 /TAXON_ID=515487 /ORGANISM="Stephanopyxis turris, Strain CCMP 815" /LENGTH=401 /DNA_ID=CAMNT_0040654387 /DNA_START=87 /DNA_END=1292 /DNA_ORIENTATION=-
MKFLDSIQLITHLLMMSQTQLVSAKSHVGFNFALALQKEPLEAEKAAEILTKTFPHLSKAKLFGSSPEDLNNADILFAAGIKEVTVAVPQFQVWNGFASAVDDAFAKTLVDTAILPRISSGENKMSIVIGNEPFASWHNTPGDALLSSYRAVRNALIEAGVKKEVKMSVPFQYGILQNTFPPSSSEFREEFKPTIEALAEHMYEDEDMFEINIYPYFAYRDNSDVIPLGYALGTNSTVAPDGIEYSSLLHAMYSGVESALLKLNSNFTEKSLIVIGETGWPTEDTPFDTNIKPFEFASIENAEEFMKNALATKIPLYIFEAFDEQLKSIDSGAGGQFSNVENNWGFFKENGDPKYEIAELQIEDEPVLDDVPASSSPSFTLKTSAFAILSSSVLASLFSMH